MIFQFLLHSILLTDTLQPPPKHWEAVAYNEVKNELAIFSGAEFNNNRFLVTDSLWLFNNRWNVVDDNNIPGRWAHALSYHENDLYTYGGLALDAKGKEIILNDLWNFQNGWKKICSGPLLHQPALFPRNGTLLLAGQSNQNKKVFETWQLTGNKLNKIHSEDTGIEPDGFTILNTGTNPVLIYFSENGLVIRDLSTQQAEVIRNQPFIDKAGITYVPNMNSYFIFGGIKKDEQFSADLYQIRDGHSLKIQLAGPSPRAGCHLVPTSKGFILYGGTNSKGKIYTDLWRFENGNWQQVVYP